VVRDPLGAPATGTSRAPERARATVTPPTR